MQWRGPETDFLRYTKIDFFRKEINQSGLLLVKITGLFYFTLFSSNFVQPNINVRTN